jgi:hypothetical protein
MAQKFKTLNTQRIEEPIQVEISDTNISSKRGRKCKYTSEDERASVAKEQRDDWRKRNAEIEKNIKKRSSPFQKQLMYYLRRNLLEPALEEQLEQLFSKKFVVLTVDTLPTNIPNDVTIVVFSDVSKKIKTRLRPRSSKNEEIFQTGSEETNDENDEIDADETILEENDDE